MRLVKESNPIELAEYAVAAGIMDEPGIQMVGTILRKLLDSGVAKVQLLST